MTHGILHYEVVDAFAIDLPHPALACTLPRRYR
jgi:hypothetical protein